MKKTYLLLALVVFLPFVYAGSFNSTLVKMDKSYSSGDVIRGIINFTALEYSANARFTSSLGGAITLLDLLRANNLTYLSGFNCSTINCSTPYAKGEAITSAVVRNGEAMAGITIDGRNVDSVHNAQITLTSDVSPSCYLPLTVILDDIHISPTAYRDVPCTAPLQGCFDTTLANYVNPVIPYDGGHYCEKISLPAAPAYRLGATVIQSTSGSARLKMTLFSADGTSIEECILPNVTQSTQSGDCIVPYSSAEPKDYYVCIEANGPSAYKIKAENNNSCGTNSIGGNFLFDYDVYAIPLQFDTPRVVINDSTLLTLAGKEFSTWVQDYVYSKYNNQCEPSCIIPFLLQGQDQTVSFNNISLQYDVEGAQGLNSNTVYLVYKGNTTITVKGKLLDLSRTGFTVPSGNSRLILSFEGNNIVDTLVNVTTGFDFSISPLSVPFGAPITYTVDAINVTKTKWNFGDSADVISNGPSIAHSFLETGMHNISVEVTLKNSSVSRKRFSIYVGDAKEGANLTITLYQQRLSKITNNISSYPTWTQNILNSNINVSNLNTRLTQLKSAYANAQNDSDYVSVMTGLLQLNVPASIVQIRKETLPMNTGLGNIDASLAESSAGEAIEDTEQFKSNLAFWDRKELSSKVTLREVGAAYDSGVQSIFTMVSVEVTTLADVPEPMLLLFSYSPNDIIFSQDYKQKSVTGGTSIAMQGSKTVDFAIADKVTLQKLGAYVIPQNIRPLLEGSSQPVICRANNKCESELGETAENCPVDCASGSNTKLIVSLIVLFVIAGGVAAFIWTWYKKRFERTLYKNSADFYNITTFIRNSRAAGVKDVETKKKLKKAGWTFDQIHYAFSKTKSSIKSNAAK